MKRIMFAVLAAASVSVLAVGCGSGSDSTDAATVEATTAAESATGGYADPVSTGDVYTDTCNGVRSYIQTMKDAGLAADDAKVQAIGDEFLNLAKSEPDWAGKSAQEQADFERGVADGVAGTC
ncbi:hypothetical protein ACFWPA_14730 [Rhodococcus sp. NPDC058505]|uniref:hypothetical protein n=1 Tax=unclassified Rhodococcus (in: high G+C Gram-positive bacteria) TaxID=192944 RepID=UPI00364DEAE6